MAHVSGHNIDQDGSVYAWNPNSRGREDAGAAGRGASSADALSRAS